jgi:hypothetical protein
MSHGWPVNSGENGTAVHGVGRWYRPAIAVEWAQHRMLTPREFVDPIFSVSNMKS